ncbi:MAG: hypothetical protein K2W99_03725, partial [Chthoniobacterales bacterium]|nr:hypothetical protein [Chthoniobacterales bacterium]
MKKIPFFFLLVSALALAPLRVNAMMKGKEDSKKEESKKQGTEYSKEQEEKELIEHVGASHDPSASVNHVLWRTETSEESHEEEANSREPEKTKPSLELDLSKESISEQIEAAKEDEAFWLERQEWLVEMEAKF